MSRVLMNTSVLSARLQVMSKVESSIQEVEELLEHEYDRMFGALGSRQIRW
jgi:hypothetical protein